MNIGGGILAKKIAKGQVVTVKIDNSSIALKLEVWVKPLLHEKAAEHYWLTETAFTYLAIDQDGKTRYIEKWLNLENV